MVKGEKTRKKKVVFSAKGRSQRLPRGGRTSITKREGHTKKESFRKKKVFIDPKNTRSSKLGKLFHEKEGKSSNEGS